MAPDPEMWDHAKTVSMIPWTVAAAALLVLAAVTFRRLSPRPCTRCVQHAETILHLREALDDARLTMLQRRHHAADLQRWAEARRERRPRRTWWPGDNAGLLPVAYGPVPERLHLDPCLAAPPDDDTLHDWLAEPQAQSFPPDRVTALTAKVIGLAGLETESWTVHIPQEANA